MEKRKWLWKRKSSERSPCETDSSGSVSSYSERLSDDQDTLKVSPMDNSQSPEITSETVPSEEDVNDGIKHLTERLSAALVNVGAKDDLVKEHVRVAEEAVAGWEKAEEEVAAMKKHLEAVTQQNSRLEDQVSHLDGALKECVRQLRQAREQQEEKIHEALVKKTQEWESTKSELQNQLLQLKEKEATISKSPTQIDPDVFHKLEYLEQENASLQLELLSQSEELEVRTIERDLSTQVAETATKQHLESIKKAARLEAECRRLKVVACKSSSFNDQKHSAASSIYVESLTDSQSDSGERLNAVELDTSKICGSESYKCEPSCSGSWASALISKLDQFKIEKTGNQNIPASAIEIDLMDDFLEMEQLAALPENVSVTSQTDPEVTANRSINVESSVRVELEVAIRRVSELEEKVQKMEGEKIEMEEKLEQMKAKKDELEMSLTQSQDKNEALQLQLRETQQKLEELQEELSMANESKQQLESQLVSMEAETQIISSKVNLLEAEVEKERILSAEIGVKCQELEEALSRKQLELELEQHSSVNVEPKIKQEDLAVAATKLAECQKTIASLGKQLSSLATLEDFLIDTASLPEFFSGKPLVPGAKEEPWKLHSNDTFSPRTGSGSSRVACASSSSSSSVDKNEGSTPSSASSSTSPALLTNHVSSEKNRNGFANFFSRSKNGIQLEI